MGYTRRSVVDDILPAERCSIFRLEPSALRFRSEALCTGGLIAVAFDFLSPVDGLHIGGVIATERERTCSPHKPSKLCVFGHGRTWYRGGVAR